jgi:hypothetical protein
MSKMQTAPDIARALPFAHYSKREGFDWWRPETAESYSENWVLGQDYALRLLEVEGPRGGGVSSLGAILLDMVAKADLKTQRGLLLGFASVFADMAAGAMLSGMRPERLRALYESRRREADAVVNALGGGENVVPFRPSREPC